MPFYAIARGRQTGVYRTWEEARKHIFKYNGALYKKFDTMEEADEFIRTNITNHSSIHDNVKKTNISISTTDIRQTMSVYAIIPNEIDTNHLIVFTDGACSGNGKRHAKGAYSSVWPYHMEYNGAWQLESTPPPTNNRAEFMGLIKSYDIADVIDPEMKKELSVYTDSMFLINCATSWLTKWKKNEFKKSDGSSVLNQDLLLKIDECMSKRKTNFHHVRAHTNQTDWFSKYNDIADKLAQSCCDTSHRRITDFMQMNSNNY